MDKAWKLMFCAFIVFVTMPLCADSASDEKGAKTTPVIYYPLPVPVINRAEYTGFFNWVNIVKKDLKDNADDLREQWRQALGVDIFFAHFKAEEIAHKIEEKSKFRIFNMRGKAKIKEDSATYTFSHKF